MNFNVNNVNFNNNNAYSSYDYKNCNYYAKADIPDLFEKQSELKTTSNSFGDIFKSKTKSIIQRVQTFFEERAFSKKLNNIYNEAFHELCIKKEYRPKLEADLVSDTAGGGYIPHKHIIKFNPKMCNDGLTIMEDVIMHEATHAKEAILRSAIDRKEVDNIVRNELTERIKNGELTYVLLSETKNPANPTVIIPPDLSEDMKQEFIDFANKYLYKKSFNLEKLLKTYNPQNKTNNDLYQCIIELKEMTKKHPEFIEKYSNEQEAFANLLDYAVSHNSRYNIYTNTDIKNSKNELIKIK